jgi:uncharacterized Ntn-hydrolase superfamily protein
LNAGGTILNVVGNILVGLGSNVQKLSGVMIAFRSELHTGAMTISNQLGQESAPADSHEQQAAATATVAAEDAGFEQYVDYVIDVDVDAGDNDMPSFEAAMGDEGYDVDEGDLIEL